MSERKSNVERCIQFDPDAVHMQSSKTGRVLDTNVDEIMDLFLFVKKLKQGEDEIIKLLENRYENAVKK